MKKKLEELKIYKEQLDTIEEKTAVKYLDELEKDLNMDNYDKTHAAILVLDNETKKEADFSEFSSGSNDDFQTIESDEDLPF